MNHTDVIDAIMTKTGLQRDLCHTIVKAFEKEAGLQILTRMGSQDLITEEIVARVANAAGSSSEDCRTVLSVMNETIAEGISNKMNRK